MSVDRLDFGVGKKFPNSGVSLARLGEDRVRHHSILVECAEGENSLFEDGRDLIDIFGRLLRSLGDEDRMGRSIGIGDVVADMIEQQHALADLPVGQADTTREGGFGDGHPDDAAFGKLVIRKSEERLVRRRIQPCDSVGHESGLMARSVSRFRSLAVKHCGCKFGHVETTSPPIDPPAETGRSHHAFGWRYILVELAIVTAGLFIALMLNGVVEWVHHKQLVHDARRNMRQEIGQNRRIIRDDLVDLKATLARVDSNITVLHQMLRNPATHATLSTKIIYSGLGDAAWQTARNTDALSYMPFDEAQGYSDLYGTIDYVNGRALALVDTNFNSMAPAEMGYPTGQLPSEEITSMLRGSARTKINLITLMQMLQQLDAQLAREKVRAE